MGHLAGGPPRRPPLPGCRWRRRTHL